MKVLYLWCKVLSNDWFFSFEALEKSRLTIEAATLNVLKKRNECFSLQNKTNFDLLYGWTLLRRFIAQAETATKTVYMSWG